MPKPRIAITAGDPAGRRYLEAAGYTAASDAGGSLAPDGVLIVGPGGGKQLAGRAAEVRDWLGAAPQCG